MVDPPASDEPLDKAFAAYLRSCDAGELTREEFLEQFPDLAGELKELISAADMITSMSQPGLKLQPPVADTGADTIAGHIGTGYDSGVDPAVTLPVANRPKGDPGPTLPFDLGDDQLQEVIGRGGMGVVYKARQNHLDRIVAVKMIRSGILASEDEVRRFYTEAQAAARLRHPGIVAVHQFGHRADHHFFSMQHIKGTDLQKKINGQTLDPRDAARYVRDVARAIQHAHQNNVLHRDLKPANVLIDLNDQIHITDFGLAKNLSADSSVTGSGAAVGTPHYMAPEQAGGHSDRASKQSDVYSMGAVLFACIAGRPPLVGDTVVQTLMQVVHNPAPPLRSLRSETPVDLETIVAKCLEKHPSKRYQTAEELADELDAFLDGRPINARPRSKVVKTWHWLEGVPVVGALTGRHGMETSASHRRFQAGMLALLLATPLVGFGSWQLLTQYSNRLPSTVRLAGGVDGGVYNMVAQRFAQRIESTHSITAEVVTTSGSFDNQRRLNNSMVELAPMQAAAVSGDDICVVAPLFYEVVYFLARTDSSIKTVQDFTGHHVAVGPTDSGSRHTAELIFDSLNITSGLTREVLNWSDLSNPKQDDSELPDAAVICVGRGSQLMTDLLKDGKWRLVPLLNANKIALQHPTLLSMDIPSDEFPKTGITDPSIPTVGTMAYLGARQDAPADLILAALDALYDKPAIFDNLISRRRAAENRAIKFHPVADHYFQRNAE